ncbi:hypothetical protein [Reichenbachiella ulvae]|uniref:Uncharacterized protein n=1 Tax=Reichenbachiella ulvae TaxID=2980104 RepID=A0ABT3CND6_9BACT|nr:hypothetical protein [Reichenbachiella ulvae]MCV9385066.1 hypothetical protein [Reichenbachiella ulvae]
MIKHIYWIAIIGMLATASCEEENESGEIEDCLQSHLEQNDMVAYDDQEISCQFFMVQYLYLNKQYYLLGNHCADMVVYPTDCDGNQLCLNQNETCDFYEKAELIGIVGIRE